MTRVVSPTASGEELTARRNAGRRRVFLFAGVGAAAALVESDFLSSLFLSGVPPPPSPLRA